MKRNLFGANKGVSLIISLGIVWVFMLLAASMGPMISSLLTQSAGYYNYTKAYYAAESGLNAGLYELTSGGTKTSGVEKLVYTENCPGTEDDDSGCAYTVTANWKIFKTAVNANQKYPDGSFSYPIPGTGTAGSTCDPWNPVTTIGDNAECEALGPGEGQEWAKLKCSITTKGGLGWKSKTSGKTQKEIANAILSSYSADELPCNWNKIKYGETVQIPLYGTNGTANTNLTFSEFKLRVRTPCKADSETGIIPEICNNGEYDGGRYVVKSEFVPYPSASETSKSFIKDILVLWSIEDGVCGVVSCFLSNMTNVISSWSPANTIQNPIQKMSLITANHIKNPTPGMKYLILNETSTGLKDANPDLQRNILNKTDAVKEGPFLTEDTSSTSFLKLHFAKQALSDEVPNKQIPYLEYQLLYKTNSNTSVITADPLITSESSVDGYKQSLQARYSPKTGVVNYVIQQ